MDALTRPPCVQVLDLSYNDLRNFVLFLPELRELHLSGNKFLQLPPGGFFPNLHTLTIQVRASPDLQVRASPGHPGKGLT